MKMTKWIKGTTVVAATFLLVACGGGGGSSSSKDDGGTPPPSSGGSGANISVAGTTASLEWIDSTIPGCEMVDASAVPLMLALSSPTRIVIDRTGSNGGPSMLQAQSINGECGGTLTINDVHQSGVTTYTVNFNNFCFNDYSGNQVVNNTIAGSIEAKDIGTPTNFGPMITRATAKSSNLVMTTGGKTMEMSFDIEHTYGNPDTWEAGIPTAANPDETTIKSARIKFPQDGKDHSISNLTFKSFETATEDTVVNVTGGVYVMTGGDTLNVSTSAPIVLDYYGELKSGSVDLAGADGKVIQVQPSSAGTMIIRVDGEQLEKALSCDGLPFFSFF